MSNTPFKLIADRFLDKIKEDKRFFIYNNNLSEDEKEEIIERRCNNLLENSILELQFEITPLQNVNFLDMDMNLKQFNFEVNLLEQDLISDKMVVKYYQEQLAAVNKKIEYVGEDGKILLPLSSERKSLINLVEYFDNKCNVKLGNYNTIDRMTNQMLMPYDITGYDEDEE